jgi:hypothetical protein
MSSPSYLKEEGEAYPRLLRRSVTSPNIPTLGIDAPDVINSIDDFIAEEWAQLLLFITITCAAER